MGKRFLTGALLLLSCVVSAHTALARPSDETLDLVLPFVASNSNLVTAVPGTDPWSVFLPTVSSFNLVHWGMDLSGVNPLLQNQSEPMVPASVLKMITAASAFQNLGPDARFENYFEASFDPASTTASDVKFTVSGDPTWGHSAYETFSARLDQVIAGLQAKGITQVNGDIQVVSTRPELDSIPRPTGWPLRWTNQCMATQVSTFMINGNCGSLKVTSLTTAVWTTPGVDLPIHLNLTAGTANNLTIKVEQDALLRVIGYTVSGQFKTPTAYFHDPLQGTTDLYNTFPVYLGTRWLKNLFILALANKGIVYQANGPSVSAPTVLTMDLSSIPLKEVLKTAVQRSINAIMDRTFFETAHVLNLPTPSDASIGLLRNVVQDESLMTGLQISDGSGLVVDDRLRADTLIAFLAKLTGAPYFNEFLATLAVSGQVGTLVNRLSGPLTKGKIFAKTGTIDNYSNLAGYYQTPTQGLLPFVIFTRSTQTASQVQVITDQIVTEFAGLNAQ
jgi:D-alanyl-D-alanine carboxypeptidase/D-alanyl-D-alanine-endopeptidase (penicillin-binding protein 4)